MAFDSVSNGPGSSRTVAKSTTRRSSVTRRSRVTRSLGDSVSQWWWSTGPGRRGSVLRLGYCRGSRHSSSNTRGALSNPWKLRTVSWCSRSQICSWMATYIQPHHHGDAVRKWTLTLRASRLIRSLQRSEMIISSDRRSLLRRAKSPWARTCRKSGPRFSETATSYISVRSCEDTAPPNVPDCCSRELATMSCRRPRNYSTFSAESPSGYEASSLVSRLFFTKWKIMKKRAIAIRTPSPIQLA